MPLRYGYMIDKAKKLLEKFPADYADIRIVRGPFTSISLKDGKIENVVSTSNFGTGIRVLSSGSFGFASTNKENELEDVMKKALKLARTTRGKITLSSEKTHADKVETKVKESPGGIGIEDKTEKLFSAEKEAKIDYIRNVSISYTDACTEKIFLNSSGSEIIQKETLTYMGIVAVAAKDGVMQEGYEVLGARGGMEGLNDAEIKAKTAAERAVKLLNAKTPKGGNFCCVIDGKLAGVLAHEAVGHACEADLVLSNDSVLSSKTGEKIGSGLVNIVDDATINGFGSFTYDDEGVPGQKKYLTKAGVLESFLHSRDTASEFNLNSTGNMRASSYSDFPVVRMSNTFFEKGEQNHDELFDIKNGIYAKGMKGGQVNPKTGNFVFVAEEGFLIKNGELTERLRDITLNGDILTTLKEIDAVGSDFIMGPGFCGKRGQVIRVSDGGPHLRIRSVAVG
ncbi:MAG: hypothetical protein A7315_00690 [Candidatus Altiarchaeales archaeon WOR_SM1_79]|nr:MAG: hypothetical protein A7315_00690 [Candidatus Altiarchaeales archaeon WOR_SM1_79]